MTIYILLLLHVLVKFSISCEKNIIYHQKLPCTSGVTSVQANSDHDMFLLWFLRQIAKWKYIGTTVKDIKARDQWTAQAERLKIKCIGIYV